MRLHRPLEVQFDENEEGCLLVRIESNLSTKTFVNLAHACQLGLDDQCYLLDVMAQHFEFMPNHLKETINSIPKTPHFYKLIDDKPHRVTFFGGTFNPFHQGHHACIELTPEDLIVVVPDLNPLKEQSYKLSPLKEFLEVCDHVKSISKASVYPGFLSLKKTNPTIDWIKMVEVSEKNLIIGDDSFMNFEKWKSYDQLLKCLDTLYVVPRNYTEADFLEQKRKFLLVNKHLKMIRLPEHLYMNESSTKLRER